MGYVTKYKGFVIPEKGIIENNDNPSINKVVLENKTLKKRLETEATIEEYLSYTNEEYRNFIEYWKKMIDKYMEEIDKQEEEKRNRRYNK